MSVYVKVNSIAELEELVRGHEDSVEKDVFDEFAPEIKYIPGNSLTMERIQAYLAQTPGYTYGEFAKVEGCAFCSYEKLAKRRQNWGGDIFISISFQRVDTKTEVAFFSFGVTCC